MIKAVLVVLFALFAVAMASDYEGNYAVGNVTVNICQDDNLISGRMGDYGIFYAKVQAKSNNTAVGKYFLLGHQYTGNRLNFKRFSGGRGRIAVLTNTTAVAFFILPKDATGASNGTLLFVAIKNSTSVGTDRVYNCAIMDRTSTLTVAGHWNTTAKSEVDGYICLTDGAKGRANGAMFGSYYFLYTFDGKATLPGYYEGYCAANAQICGTVFYQNNVKYDSYTSFGAELIYRLSDDRLVIQHTRGAPGVTGFETFNTGFNPLTRQGTASEDQCNKEKEDNFFNPTKCRKFDLKFCKDIQQYGFCMVADQQGSCVRNNTWKTA